MTVLQSIEQDSLGRRVDQPLRLTEGSVSVFEGLRVGVLVRIVSVPGSWWSALNSKLIHYNLGALGRWMPVSPSWAIMKQCLLHEPCSMNRVPVMDSSGNSVMSSCLHYEGDWCLFIVQGNAFTIKLCTSLNPSCILHDMFSLQIITKHLHLLGFYL